MAGGNLGDLWFNLSIKSNVRQDLNAIGEMLQGLDLKSARTRKDLEGIFGGFNKTYAKEISDDFKNIAAQMNIQREEAVKLSARLRELAKLKADIIERDRQSTEHGAFVAMQNESQQAQALAQRYTELAKLKENILARDKEMEAHGAFVALVNESQQAQALAQRERELLQLKEAIIRRNDEMVAAENRLAEATRRTNQARQEAVAHTRQQAEALVKLRVQELEAQRRQIQGLFGQGKNILSTEELAHLRSAFSQITQELNTLRTAMSNLGSYSARDLFSMGRGTSDFSPLISNMRAVVSEKQKAVQLEERHRQEVTATAAKVRGDLVSAFEQARKSASGVSSAVQDLKNLFLQGGIVYGVQQFANSIIQSGGEMEKQHIALQSILGDMQNADIMFQQIKSLALESPFTFSELNKDVKQLAAYGVEYEELYDTTKRLADMASGLGVSFERIALAFGQVRARGWLDGKELRQISYAGIPILNKLSEYYSKKEGQKVSTSDVKKRISNREVDFSDVKQIFWDMTDAGGQFYNMQEVLSETLLGRYNKLKDAWEIMLADFARGGSIVGGTFKTIIGLVTTLVQNINTIGPALMAVFGTVAMRKGLMAMGGNVGGAMLSVKASVATDIQKRLILGQQVSSTELRILATKRQITNEDFKALATARALTRNDLERLMLQGKITRQMYAQNIGGVAQMTRMGTMRRVVALRQEGGLFNKMQVSLLKLNLATNAYFTRLKIELASSGTLWSSFAVKGLSAFTLLGSGVKALGATMWAAIGGLPGLLMTAVTMGIGYMISANAELRQALDQSQDELENRKKQIGEFLRDHDASKAINSGDQKEIDNMIEEYKDKLKELAPSMSGFFVMNANEKKSHEERLRYLRDEMEAMKKANATAQIKLSNKDTFESLKEYFTASQKMLNTIFELKGKAQMYNATDNDKKEYANAAIHYEDYAREIGRKFASILPDVGRNPESQRAVVQMFDNMLAQANIPEEQADYMRASVMRALGIADGWLENQVSTEMKNLIDSSSSVIADKIRNNIELTDAEKSKVEELMADAKKNLTARYPQLAEQLQRLLDASNFQAIIKLVFSMQTPPGELENQVMNNILGHGKVLLRDSSTYSGYAKKWVKGTEDPYEAVNRAHQDIDAALNSLERWKRMLKSGKAKKSSVDEAEKTYNDLVNANYEAFGDRYLGQKKKSNKTPKSKTNKEDKVLKELRARIDLYKKFYEELQKFKKIYGSGALAKLKERGDFSPVFSYGLKNVDDYNGSIKDLLSRVKSSTADRINYKNNEIGGIADKDRQKEEQRIDDVNSALREKLNLLSEEYDTYKKLYELTGDRNSSMRLAFGGNVQSGTMKEYLANEMKEALPEANKRSGQKYTADEVLAMSEADFKAAYGEKSEKVSEIFYKYRDELKKIQKETIDLMTKLVQENATIDQQIADLDRNHERNVALINGDKNMSPEFKARALAGEDKSYNDKRSSLRFEQFKQSTDWVKVFDDLDRVSNTTIDNMIRDIDRFSKEGNLSVEVVKQLREALSKLRKENMERNPFDVLMNTTSQANAIGSFLKDKNNKVDKDGKYTVSEAQGKKMGLEAGKYSKADLEGEQRGKYADFTKSIQSVANKFKALNDIMTPVLDLLAAYGKEDTTAGRIMKGGGDALGAAASTAGAFQTLSQMDGLGAGAQKLIGNLGPYGAAASAAVSIIGSFAAAHDAALQKEIEASQQRQKEMENLTKNIKSTIESTLGGIYNFKISEVDKKLLYDNKSKYSSKTQAQISKGQRTGSAFDNEYASLMAQRDEVDKQMNAESKKKNSDSSAISDYKQQIRELDHEIETFVDDWAKDIYNIDLKDWASQLTDAIVEAWSKGEDAVDAYKDKVQELIKTLTKNIISQSILEIALEPVQKDIRNLLQKNEGKLQPDDVTKIADELGKTVGNSVDNIENILDALKAKGYDLSENGSLSVSNSIKGVTEETADLLASYINAIRLDVSVNRENITMIAEAVKNLPNLNVIAQSQLEQLTTLVSLARTRNEMISNMYDWMRALTNGTKKLSVA